MIWSNHWLVHTTLLGMLLGIGFVIPPLWPLGLLGIAGLFYTIQMYSWLQVWWVWYIKSLLVASWIWRVYPMDWLGFELGWVELPMIGLYWSTVSAALAVGGVGLYWLVRLFTKFVPIRFFYVGFPVLWLGAELVGSLAFSIFLFGPGGSIGTTYSMGYMGYLLGEHQLLVLFARLGGVYGLSLLYVAIALIGVWLYRSARKQTLYFMVGCLIVSSGWSVSFATVETNQTKVAVVNTMTPVDIGRQEVESIHAEVFTAAKKTNPDYIIFPEDSRVFDQSLAPGALEAVLAFKYADADAVIVDSGRVDTKEGTFLQAAIFDATTKDVYQSQKRYLVPQGEFLPYVYATLLRLVGQADSSTALNDRLVYKVGPNTSQAHFSIAIPAVLFCFEVVDARGVRRIMQEREGDAPFVAHILSHAWIHDSVVFKKQLETILRVQAIWNDVYIVSAANQTEGYTVTPTGQIIWPETEASGTYWSVGTILIPEW